MDKGGKPQSAPEWSFDIKLDSEEIEESSDYWQSQCNLLYNTIQKELPSGSIEPLSYESVEGEKAVLTTIFSIIKFTGIGEIAFGKICDILKIWLENRPKSKVTLKYPDGSTMELSGLPTSEALKLMEEHYRKITIR